MSFVICMVFAQQKLAKAVLWEIGSPPWAEGAIDHFSFKDFGYKLRQAYTFAHKSRGCREGEATSRQARPGACSWEGCRKPSCEHTIANNDVHSWGRQTLGADRPKLYKTITSFTCLQFLGILTPVKPTGPRATMLQTTKPLIIQPSL